MAVHSLVLDGTRHVDNNGFTRCGKLIPFGTPWEEDPLDGEPSGKLCKACYATVDAEAEQQAEINAQHDEEAKAALPEEKPLPKAAKSAKKG